MKSENFVEKITKVMKMEYLNPFDVKLDPKNLYNLSSDVPVEASLAEEVLSVKQLGEECYKDFVDKRIRKTTLKIHDPIPVMKRNYSKVQGRMSFCITKAKNKLWMLIGTSCGSC